MRIIVASTMKSGSTYVARVLRLYFETENPVVDYYWPAEQNLTYELLEQLRDRSFSINMHLLPHAPNLAACEREGIRLIHQWRNLGDVIVSFDDHIRRESEANPVAYIGDRERYLRLPSQKRYTFLIDAIIPWYLGFYLRWRRRQAVFHAYERMLADRFAFFSEVLAQLGQTVDVPRLRGLLADKIDHTRLNVGRNARSAKQLDDGHRWQIEQLVSRHPEREQLDVLLWELPWGALATGQRSRLDGMVVRPSDSETSYFVTRGCAHPILDVSWLRSRSLPQLREARRIEPFELLALERGAPLY